MPLAPPVKSGAYTGFRFRQQTFGERCEIGQTAVTATSKPAGLQAAAGESQSTV